MPRAVVAAPGRQILMGYYAAADTTVQSKGTVFFELHPQGEYAEGRWVGLSHEGPIVSGHAALARTQADVKTVMTRLQSADDATT